MPSLDPNEVRFFSGSSHPKLASEIASYLNVPLDTTIFKRFSNDNLYLQLGASVRGRVVFIVQSLTQPVSDHLMELFMMLDIARGAGAKEIHAIIPYFSYSRSDKKDAPRISITARLVADLLQASGATHIMTMNLHSPQVHGFFSVPTDPLTPHPLFDQYFRKRQFSADDTIVVSPDMGRAKDAALFADHLDLPVAAAEKKRISDTKVIIDPFIARQVSGFKRAIVYDDEISTGGTIITLSEALISCDIQDLILVCTHGVFTSDALEKLSKIPQISSIVTTNTVPIAKEKRIPTLTVLSVAPIFGEAIWRNSTRQSLGDLFPYGS